MTLFRSVTVGLLGACLYFVVQVSRAQSEPEPMDRRQQLVEHSKVLSDLTQNLQQRITAMSSRTQIARPVTVVDVAHGVPATAIPALVHVGPGERITAVDDREASSDLVAGAMMLERIRDGRFIDLTIESATSTRRVLVLLH
jgi:hypothetical protein